MILGCLKESLPGERRVAITPAALAAIAKTGAEILVEAGAGAEAGFSDSAYTDKGAKVVSRDEIFSRADLILAVQCAGANPAAGAADLARMRAGQALIGFCDPLANPESIRAASEKGITLLSMEMMPRITRAQSMDALSSMATVAGYKAVLLAADALPKFFPMLTTAAGSIAPAKIFVVGAGVAGLQAIATARRLGGVVSAYDIRDAAREQVKSLGAKFVELGLETAASETKGGYAKAMDEAFLARQREVMTKTVAHSDVVITTASVPGRKAPVLITGDMARGMSPGSVIVDLAAERGGNCELTRPGETVIENGVRILGPVNLPAAVPYDASQMYARNITTFAAHLIKEGVLTLDLHDEITRETLVVRDGEILHAEVRSKLGLPALPPLAAATAAAPTAAAAN